MDGHSLESRYYWLDNLQDINTLEARALLFSLLSFRPHTFDLMSLPTRQGGSALTTFDALRNSRVWRYQRLRSVSSFESQHLCLLTVYPDSTSAKVRL